MAPGAGCADGCCAPGCCSSGCCGGGWGAFGSGCCFGNRWYGTAEYLLWFIRGQPLPVIATAGSVNDNPPAALGQPGTTVLFGGNTSNFNPLSGGRLLLGYWFGDNHCLGMEVGGFGLAQGVNSFSATSAGSPFVARPFVNALTGAQDIEAVATPNGLTGTVSSQRSQPVVGRRGQPAQQPVLRLQLVHRCPGRLGLLRSARIADRRGKPGRHQLAEPQSAGRLDVRGEGQFQHAEQLQRRSGRLGRRVSPGPLEHRLGAAPSPSG